MARYHTYWAVPAPSMSPASLRQRSPHPLDYRRTAVPPYRRTAVPPTPTALTPT
jgi:hypothetical protein